MKRLYNCKAWYDENGLISYETQVIKYTYNGDKLVRINYKNYRSNTTLMHIRKYIKLLTDEGETEKAMHIQQFYDIGKLNKRSKGFYVDL